ncbi:MAG: phage baseplate assembly protein V [Oscillospiraceae bacterium]|jgi:uncharacterized protein involved in type VI secretion and phage assembly|nr:phage baseplate assembly protein V [Oscillospiraceae bacterium]
MNENLIFNKSSNLPPSIPIKMGVVKSLEDPDNENRILVSFAEDNSEYWAHVLSPCAGNNFGLASYPNAGETAIVAFIDGSPYFPVILGFVFDKKNVTPLALDKENKQETFISRGGFSVLLMNEPDKQTITFKTKKEHQFFIDDENELWKISSKDEKTLFSIDFKNGEIIINAKKITIKGEQDTMIFEDGKGWEFSSSGGKLAAKVSEVAFEAQSKFSAKGNGGAEVQSGANLVLKGSMTQIN